MLRHIISLFVGVLSAVGVNPRTEVALASTAPMSKHWPAAQLSAQAITVLAVALTALALTPQELHSVLLEWIAARREYQGRMEIMWHDCRVGLLVAEEEQRKYVGCGAGRLIARILPDGTVTPCVFLPTPIGNIPRDGFKSLWTHSLLLAQFRDRHGHVLARDHGRGIALPPGRSAGADV